MLLILVAFCLYRGDSMPPPATPPLPPGEGGPPLTAATEQKARLLPWSATQGQHTEGEDEMGVSWSSSSSHPGARRKRPSLNLSGSLRHVFIIPTTHDNYHHDARLRAL